MLLKYLFESLSYRCACDTCAYYHNLEVLLVNGAHLVC